MFSKIAEDNLTKDKHVLGKEWTHTYNGYFSDEENITHFVDSVLPFLDTPPLDILYVASASGLLGEKLLSRITDSTLTLVDISQKHLSENRNQKTNKICCDLSEMNLGKKFDVILMRSALDYFPTRQSQISVLEIIRDHLKQNALFINQPAYLPDCNKRDVISSIYTTTEKIGNRFFQSTDMAEIYKKAGFDICQKIGTGKELIVTEQEHIERYKIRPEDVRHIQDILRQSGNEKMITKNGYMLTFQFPIFLTSRT